MTARVLAPVATVADIVPTLGKPVPYVRGILQNMHECKLEKGSARVRIGTTGRGIVPHYRVELDHGKILEDRDAFFVAYHGTNHKILEWGLEGLRFRHWSSRAMSYDQVQQLLPSLRNVKPKGKQAA
jgi:hypothetical protein